MDIQTEHYVRIAKRDGWKVEPIWATLTPGQDSQVFKVKKAETEAHLTDFKLEDWVRGGCKETDLQRLKIKSAYFIPFV